MQLQKLEATPTLGSNNQVTWKLCHTNPSPPKCGTTTADYPAVALAYNTGAANFQVKIVGDTTGKDIKFASDPIWVQANAKPTVAGLDAQIPPTSVSGGGQKVLTFVDLNNLPNASQPQALTLKYQLNFTDGQGNAVTAIDPDIKNGGTGLGGGGEISAATYLTIGVAVIAVLALAWFGLRYFRRQSAGR